MRRWMVAVGWVALVACEGSTATAPQPTGGGGSVAGCAQPSDCDDDNPCTSDQCVAGQCESVAVANGPAPGEQIPGDCLESRCNAGALTVVDDDDDPPPDEVTGDCLEPICSGGQWQQGPGELGGDCLLDGGAPGVCDGNGDCGCVPPGADALHFVDPVLGADDLDHGGAAQGCAYRSLTYALTQATGPIALAQAVYSTASGETLPFVLTASQQLLCRYEGDDGAVLAGQGVYSTTTATVVFVGEANGLSDCIVEAESQPGYAVMIQSAQGLQTDGHYLRGCDVSGAGGTGIVIQASGSGVEISDSTIHDNGVTGIYWYGMGLTGAMTDNTFAANGTSTLQDIACHDSLPEVTGSGNVHTGGALFCSGCAYCPFE